MRPLSLLAAALAAVPALAAAAGKPGRVEGTVLDPAQKPVAGATVDCIKGVGGGDNASACGPVQTGPDGTFSLPAPAGVITVWARAPGFAEGRAALVVPQGVPVKASVVLPPASAVVGIARTEDGKPVPNANVRCGALDDLGPVQQLRANPDGTFVCKDVGSGPVEVLAWTEQARGATMTMVDPGGKADLALSLSERESASARIQVSGPPGLSLSALPPADAEPPGVIKGRVVDAATRKPVANLGLKVKPGRWAVTGPDGRFSALAGPGPTVIDLATARGRVGGALVAVPSDGEVDAGDVRVITGAGEDVLGLGLKLELEGLVLDPKLDGPAWKSGARPGDKVLKIAGKPAAGMQLADAILAARAYGRNLLVVVDRGGKQQEILVAWR